MTSAICNTVFFVRSLALSQNPRLEHLLASNQRAGQDLVVHQGFPNILNPILDQDQNPGQGQGGIPIDATLDPGHTLIGDDLGVGPIHPSIGGGGAGVTLQCLIAEGILAAGQTQILTLAWEYLASVCTQQREIFVKCFLDMDL